MSAQKRAEYPRRGDVIEEQVRQATGECTVDEVNARASGMAEAEMSADRVGVASLAEICMAIGANYNVLPLSANKDQQRRTGFRPLRRPQVSRIGCSAAARTPSPNRAGRSTS